MIHNEITSALINGSSSLPFKTYSPREYKDRQHEYYNHESRTFNEMYAKYSSDYVEAEIQGLNPDLPFEYTKVHVRFAEIIKPSGSIESHYDSYKHIMIAERQYDYLRPGAKIKAMGNIWLVINPANLSGGGTAIVHRCDAVWNYHDYYGNVCSEPMCIDTLRMRASTPDSQRSTMITKGYFNVLMQYNEATKQLFTNSRMILGSSAFILTGFSDFLREFTFEEDSVNLLEFSIRYEEPNDAIDDMVNHIAGGKTFAWDISIHGEPTLNVGETQTLTATSVRTSGAKTETVISTQEYPIDYLWESEDESVVTVNGFGEVTAVGEGATIIKAILMQNPDKYMEFPITVASIDTQPHVAFISTIPNSLSAFRTITLQALYYVDGDATSEVVTWDSYGANEDCYSLSVNGNTATLKCWAGSVEPVVITATYGNCTAMAKIYLEGI